MDDRPRGTDISQMRRKYRMQHVGQFPDQLELKLNRESDLRYGENPNQAAAVYTNAAVIPELSMHVFKYAKEKGNLSATNVMDILRAVEQAIIKAYQKAMDREKIPYDPLEGALNRTQLSTNPLEGAVLASDGFFPFRDSIDRAASVGISGIIQPGGSDRDYEVIQAVNEHKLAMAFTLERCFGHF